MREQWLIFLLAVVLTTAAAAAVALVRPPEYTANLRMYVSAQSVDTAQSAYQGAQLSQQRVTSYVELVSSTRVSEEVIRRLRLTETPDQLADHIKASSKVDSVIIDVAVTGRSRDEVAASANAVGDVFPELVDELERPSSPRGVPPVAVRVVEPAVTPDKPSSITLPVAAALGLLAGLLVGTGGALARNALDTSVKSPDQLRELSGVPNLGVIAYDPAVPKRPLIVHEDPQSPRAEAFRQLRTNLRFLDVDTPHKIVAVTSPLPSEGKSTTLANLAIALASSGQRVIAVEADLRRPKLADMLGMERAVGLTSVLSGRVSLELAVQPWSTGVFDLLASGPLPPNPSELLGSAHMSAVLERLSRLYDVVLLDTPPILPVTDAAAVASAADGMILVCRFKRTSRNQMTAARDALAAVSAPLIGTVLTMVPKRGARAYAQYNTYYRTEPATEARPARPAAVRPPSRPIDTWQAPHEPTPPHSRAARRSTPSER